MSNSPENFEKLTKLLKLKKHEQPPPGYYSNFSRKVLARIEAEAEATEGFSGTWAEVPWVRKFLRTMDAKPILAGVFGMVICSLLITGLAYSEYHSNLASIPNASMVLDVAEAGNSGHPMEWKGTADALPSSTGPVMGTNGGGGSLFSPVSFTTPQ